MSVQSILADKLYGTLSTEEIRWSGRQQFLKARGYMLRPRYWPGWSPSWRKTGQDPLSGKFDDSIALPLRERENYIDATRMSDGKLVYIKRVKTDSKDSRMSAMLSSPALRGDAKNHCVPVLDIFQDSDDSSVSYMVTPYLKPIDSPPFENMDELINFVDQVLEGLSFMHKRGFAHRDCTYENIMMDASAMYPTGSAGVKYYFTEFGLSTYLGPEVWPKLVRDSDPKMQELPEFSDFPTGTAYDPFKADVYVLGDMLRQSFFEIYSNVDFLLPLINAMTQPDPVARPDADGAIKQWKAYCLTLSSISRRWRLARRDEAWPGKVVKDTLTLVGATTHVVSSAIGLRG